jgi:serine/threonine protein kinase
MLSKAYKKLFSFLRTKRAGDLVAMDELLQATGLKESSLATYIRKNKLRAYLQAASDGGYRTLQDGPSITEAAFDRAMTQVSQAEPVLTEGSVMKGSQKYFLVCQLGSGAAGQVWQARDSQGREFAIKMLLPRPDLLDPSKFPNVEERFVRESRNGRKLQSPYLVRHLDSGEFEGRPFLVMALTGKSVRDVLSAGPGVLPSDHASMIVERVLLGLQYLHGQSAVHRDIKPGNILSTQDGYVLGDLGIVRWDDLNPAFTEAGTITKDSVQLGSIKYMAPEQRLSPHNVGPAADVYSLGVTWYELLTGQVLDPAQAARGAFADPSADPEVNRLIRAMVTYEPESRPGVDALLAHFQRRTQQPQHA